MGGGRYQKDGENYIMRSFIIFTLQILLGWLMKEGEANGLCSAHVRDENYITILVEKPERNIKRDVGICTRLPGSG
jgi:hypothetical protein